MLGTRTKQVFSYGRRNQRIVNVSDDRDRSNNDPIFPERPTLWAPVASRMKKRENIVPKSKSPSPKTVHVQKKKKRHSPILSPPLRSLATVKKRTRVQHVIDADSRPPSADLSKIILDLTTPIRRPLGTFALNHPGSPAISAKAKKKPRVPGAKGTPRGLTKPFSPFVDMDIIVLDDDGRTLSQERRVSRTGVQVNAINRDGQGLFSESRHNIIDLSGDVSGDDAESDIVPQLKSKRTVRRAKAAIVYSDDSEPDIESAPQLPQSPERPSPPTPKPAQLPPRTPRLPVDVVVPALRPTLGQVSTIKPAIGASRIPAAPSTPQTSRLPQSQPGPTAPLPKFQYIPSPAPRPRQLTPIRGGRNSRFIPPSPSSTIDLELSLEYSELSIDDIFSLPPSLRPQNTQPNHREVREDPEYLRRLLAECAQERWGPHEFSAFIEMFPLDPIAQGSCGADKGEERLKFRKIGEASYSEVFGIGDVVLKVIPLQDENVVNGKGPTPTQATTKAKSKYGENDIQATLEEDGPPPSDAKDVLKEVIVTRAMGEMCEGFVKLLRTYVVRGRYPEVLLELWDEYYERKGSESIRPDTFNVSQTYAIIVLPNGGPDLEAYTFTNASRTGWRQACSLFWQVTRSLAQAEQLVSFEHRDLHWGQILIKNIPSTILLPLKTKKLSDEVFPNSMDEPVYGVKATLIDLGLSRMDAGDGEDGVKVHWTPFAEEIFMGEGEYQFDIYRIMREHNQDAWEEYRPMTNVLWLHYLLIKLLHSKHLKPPPVSRKLAVTATPATSFTEKNCYDCLVEVEKVLDRCVDAVSNKAKTNLPTGRGRKKAVAGKAKAVKPEEGPQSASDVIGYGLKRGWVR